MAVDKMDDCFIKDRPEDVSWLCSLSKSEIDMLILLKSYILHRAKIIGHEELAEKFDLKMLRAIVFIMMEYCKEKVKDSSLTLDAERPADFLDACNLLRCDQEGVTSIEYLSKNIGIDPQHTVIGPQEEVGTALEVVGSNLKKRKRKGFFIERRGRNFRAKNE